MFAHRAPRADVLAAAAAVAVGGDRQSQRSFSKIPSPKNGVIRKACSVGAIDGATRTVTWCVKTVLGRDRRVSAPGVSFNDVYGLTQVGYDMRTPQSWCNGDPTTLLGNQAAAMRDGEFFVTSIPNVPAAPCPVCRHTGRRPEENPVAELQAGPGRKRCRAFAVFDRVVCLQAAGRRRCRRGGRKLRHPCPGLLLPEPAAMQPGSIRAADSGPSPSHRNHIG